MIKLTYKHDYISRFWTKDAAVLFYVVKLKMF